MFIRVDQQAGQWFALVWVFKALAKLLMQCCEAVERFDATYNAVQDHSPDWRLRLKRMPLRALLGQNQYTWQVTTPIGCRAAKQWAIHLGAMGCGQVTALRGVREFKAGGQQ
ncbi:hypothetical protein D3C76_1619900 [compost metagenome]